MIALFLGAILKGKEIVGKDRSLKKWLIIFE